MSAASPCRLLAPALALALVHPACGRGFEGGGDLRAQRVVLEREVEGLREIVGRLETGEPMLPPDDVLVAVSDSLLRDLIAAQLPIDLDVDRFHLTLKEAEAHFRGSPLVRLRGTLTPRERPDLAATVSVFGALEDIRVEPATSTLRAGIAVDHLGIETAAGIEQVLGGSRMDEVARLLRLQVEGRLPPIQIPVKVQQTIDLPAVTTGPVRIHGATMPIQATVSQVLAGQGQLWISVRFRPGDFSRTVEAPEAGDASAAEAGVGLGDDGPGAARGKGK
jgi:hypothetical protein